MALTIAAKLLTSLAPTVSLEIHSTSPLTQIVRSDRNGIKTVRTPNLDLSAGILLTTDYEPAYGTITYSVSNTSGEYTDISLAIATSLPIIHSVNYPTRWARIESITEWEHTRESSVRCSQSLESPYPSVTFGVMRARHITASIIASSYAQAIDLEALFSLPGTIMLRQAEHEGLDAYLVCTSTSITPNAPNGTDTSWLLSIDAQETAAPQGAPLEASINTYGISLNEYPTYISASVKSTYYERTKL